MPIPSATAEDAPILHCTHDWKFYEASAIFNKRVVAQPRQCRKCGVVITLDILSGKLIEQEDLDAPKENP